MTLMLSNYPKELITKTIAIAAIKQNPENARFIPSEVLSEKECLFLAINHPDAISYLKKKQITPQIKAICGQ